MSRVKFIARKEELQRKLNNVQNKLTSNPRIMLNLLNQESNLKEQLLLIKMDLDKDVYTPMEL